MQAFACVWGVDCELRSDPTREWPYAKPEKEKPPVKFKGKRRHSRREERYG